MAAPALNNPQAGSAESKTSKKKKAKAAAAAEPERVNSPAPTASSEVPGDNGNEHPYIKELHKQIRNINKKLSNMAKTEAIQVANSGKTPDQLLAEKLINADQRAQIEKKPALTAHVKELEEQLTQFKKLEDEHKAKTAELEKEFAKKRDQAVAKATQDLKKKLDQEHTEDLRNHLLSVSQFLRLAAGRRSETAESNADPNSDENLAIEGVLLAVYLGEQTAVDSMIKLTSGTNETTESVNGQPCEATYAEIKEAVAKYNAPITVEGEGEAEVRAEAEAETAETVPATDPTVANASLTEIKAGDDSSLVNGHTTEEQPAVPANADVGNATNEAGDLATSQDEWVKVSVDESSSPEAAPATESATEFKPQSWADDHPDHHEAPVDPNDGFQSVPGRRGRDHNTGNRGYRGGRGRGNFRGDGRGRGRGGGGRGGGPQRGPRRQEA